MKRPEIDNQVVIRAETMYEQLLAGYIIKQHEYINFLESELNKIEVPEVTGDFKTVTFRSKL